ncbi:MAG TPA: host attachment protein [Methylovirgula sp.]|nr:host attachment protein [Methylovirgula sp.]
MKIGHGDLILVCDGRKALLLENEGDEMLAKFATREVHEYEEQRTSDLGTDKPGRYQEMATGARSAVQQTDFHDQQETIFLDRLSARLDGLLKNGKAHHFIIVAPPRALGALRKAYSPAVRKAIRAEVDHDLIHLPVPEIEARLTGA